MDLSRQELADQAGCAEITMRRIEGGTLKPSKELAAILLEKVGIPNNEINEWVHFARGQAELPDAKPINTPNQPKTNLPAQLTSFIGREKELADVSSLLEKHRLVTLIGSGGVGKTRLSIKMGENHASNFPDGVWLMELAPLESPQLIPQTLAATLGVPASAAHSVTESILNYLYTKTPLLIFDNCEHLLDACTQLTDTLLKRCPNLKIIATSREALGIMGEAMYLVPTLALPDADKLLNAFRDVGSMRLFEERAQLVQMDFSLTMANASFVAQICHRLDGIPLALELAAVQVSQFSPAEIAKQLEESFQILTDGSRTALPRQQTIRASIDWSWNLLTDEERILLRRLSVFAGGCSLESASDVCGDGNDVRAIMGQLVRKSLVVVNQVSGRETRYHFHEVIRQYAREKIVEAGELDVTRQRHLLHFLKLSEQAEHALVGPDQMKWYDRVVDECDNLRTAMNCAMQTNNIEAGLNLPGNLGGGFWESFDVSEGLEWLTWFLQRSDASMYPLAKAKALKVQGRLYFALQRFDDARRSEEAALALYRALGDLHGEIDVLLVLGGVMQFLEGWDRKSEIQKEALRLAQSINDLRHEARAYGALGWDHRDVEKAFEYWRNAIQLFRQVGDWGNLSFYLGVLGEWLVSRGEIQEAEQLLREAGKINQRMNNHKEMEFILTSYGYIALVAKDYDRAIEHFRENARLMDEVGNRMGYLWAQARLGYALVLKGDISAAQNILFETLNGFHEDGNKGGVVFTMSKLASLYIATNEFEKASQLIGWSDSNLDGARSKLEQTDVDHDIQLIQERTGIAIYSDAYNKGCSLNMDEVIALALHSRNDNGIKSTKFDG